MISNIIIHRSVLQSAIDDGDHPNLRALNLNYDGIYDNVYESNSHVNIKNAGKPHHAIGLKRDADNMDDTSLPIDDRPVVLISRNDISLNDEALVDSTTSMNVPDLHDLIGFTFPMEHDGIVQKAFVTEQDKDSDDYFIELMDGSKQLIEYNLLLEK